MSPLDAYQRPPESLRSLYKHYQNLDSGLLNDDPNIIDLSRGLTQDQRLEIKAVRSISHMQLRDVCSHFRVFGFPGVHLSKDVHVFQHETLLGLHILPSLLPAETQWSLLSKLLHRDLANEQHKTNVHMHHKIPYHIADAKESNDELRPRAFEKNESFMDSRSFFNCSPSDTEVFTPIDPLVHKPITISQFFRTKLRWMTLGGQYDWTEKKYPNVDHPAFPEDIANFIRGLFPEMNPEAAIVNVYSPGNTLSLHRDVSEESDHGLVSISLGCDGIFIVGIEEMGNNRAKSLVIRLRSGDAVYMSGPSRYAWHGIPLIVPNTCPDWLEAWPARESDVKTAERMETQNHEAWRGWMANKRINLNVRQMKDHRPCPV